MFHFTRSYIIVCHHNHPLLHIDKKVFRQTFQGSAVVLFCFLRIRIIIYGTQKIGLFHATVQVKIIGYLRIPSAQLGHPPLCIFRVRKRITMAKRFYVAGRMCGTV